jgi:hypothetical protein
LNGRWLATVEEIEAVRAALRFRGERGISNREFPKLFPQTTPSHTRRIMTLLLDRGEATLSVTYKDWSGVEYRYREVTSG